MNLNHYIKVLQKIVAGNFQSYGRSRLLIIYLRLIFHSILYHKLLKRASQIPIETIFGFRIRFHTYPELINLFEEIFIYEVYKCPGANPKVIVDCGSNIGISIVYFSLRYPTIPILAFEPAPANFNLLAENIRLNQLQQVKAHRVALSNIASSGKLYLPSVNGSLNWTLINTGAPPVAEPVDVAKLSTFIIQPHTLLKLDVEGAEEAILRDLDDSGKIELLSFVVAEVHPGLPENSPEEVTEILEKRGFVTTTTADLLHIGAHEFMVYAHRLQLPANRD